MWTGGKGERRKTVPASFARKFLIRGLTSFVSPSTHVGYLGIRLCSGRECLQSSEIIAYTSLFASTKNKIPPTSANAAMLKD